MRRDRSWACVTERVKAVVAAPGLVGGLDLLFEAGRLLSPAGLALLGEPPGSRRRSHR